MTRSVEPFHTEQEYYKELIACVRLFLEDNPERDKIKARAILLQSRERARRTIRSGGMIALEYIFHVLQLSEFEAYMVILSLSSELDYELSQIISRLNTQTYSRIPTIGLCIRSYADEEEERLELWRQFVENKKKLGLLFDRLENTEGSMSAQEIPLKLDGRISSYLQAYEQEDEELGRFVRLQASCKGELLIQQEIQQGLLHLYDHGARTYFLCGETGSGKKLQCGFLCEAKKLPVLYVDSVQLMEQREPSDQICRRIKREAILKGNAAICFTGLPGDEEDRVDAQKTEKLLHGMRDWNGLLFFTSIYEWNRSIEGERKVVKIRIPDNTTEDRILLWDACLQEELRPADLNLIYLADKYRLTAGTIRDCVEEYQDRLLMKGAQPNMADLLAACTDHLEHRLGRDAVRIEAKYRWEDLILPKPQKKLLADACDQVLLHHQVYHRWGFDKKLAYGKGVSMIFYGPPGTGKTMGAQVIANRLQMELYKVEMSGVLSKYVGESEKKLGNIFEQAKKSQSILFFDEADVLFGKRTDQKDSNDKYSNAGTAYLLQKIEEYEGIIILATNFLQNFDNAFLRRFQFIIEFPFTDVPRRKEIWQKVFPPELPREELDLDFLAEEFHFSGSQIKNVAVAAAFLAAGEQTSLNMKHVLTAVKREMTKTGKTLIASDFGVYYYLMEEVEG